MFSQKKKIVSILESDLVMFSQKKKPTEILNPFDHNSNRARSIYHVSLFYTLL